MKGVRERGRCVFVCVRVVCLLDLPPYLILRNFQSFFSFCR